MKHFCIIVGLLILITLIAKTNYDQGFADGQYSAGIIRRTL